MGTLSRFTNSMPSMIKRLYYASIPFSMRYSGYFLKVKNLLSESQWWDSDKLKTYQMEQLKLLLNHAYSNVPYYGKVFSDYGLKPNDIQDISDLQKLPILTRDLVRENFVNLIDNRILLSDIINFSTSGSTGNPLKFVGNDKLYKSEAAFINRAFEAHGAKLYNEKTIWLRHYVPEVGGPIFKNNYELNRLYLSPYHLSIDRVREYVDLINNYKARVIVGYPSSLYILALLLEESGLRLKHIKIAHAASENMLSKWKEKINSILGVSVKMHYGMVERVSMFFQCSHTDFYHESLEYGVTEFINNNGIFSVIGTGFLNYVMPFIRYQANDFATLNTGSMTCTCGRGLPLSVENFDGRLNDILITSEGRYIPGVNFFPTLSTIHGIKMFQIIQKSPSYVEVKIVPSNLYDENCMIQVKKCMIERLGNIEINIVLVDSIERSLETGKIRCIINYCK